MSDKKLLRISLAVGLAGILANCVARTQMVAAADDIGKQDAFGWIFFLGACVFSLSIAVAAFLIVNQRFAAKPWAKLVGLLSAVVLACCLMIGAIYWPWFLTAY